jgi:hypothetical protein
MSHGEEPDGKNSLLGEFLLALARAPENVQEAIIIYGIKQLKPYSNKLINPYPMLSHMVEILESQNIHGQKKHGTDGGHGDHGAA